MNPRAMLLLLLLLPPLAFAQTASPEIAYITQSVDEGAGFVIMGERLDPGVEVFLWHPGPDSRETILRTAAQPVPPLPPAPPPGAEPARILGKPSGRLLIAAQLGRSPALGDEVTPTVAWVKNAAGFSAPYLFNGPILVFLSDPEVLPGQRLRLFGRNLEPRDLTNGAKYDYPVAFQSAGGTMHFGKVLDFDDQTRVNVKPFQLQVQVPRDLPPGDYTVRVHALMGGPSAWSNPLRLKCVSGRDWVTALARPDDHPLATPARSAGRPPRIGRLTGAAADGFSDDSEAIQGSIDRLANAGGGVLLFSAGSYAITRTIHLRPNVVLAGAGRAATQIVVAAHAPLEQGFPFAGEKLFQAALNPGAAGVYAGRLSDEGIMIWLDDRSGLRDMSIIAGAASTMAVLIGTDDPERVVRNPFLGRVEIINTHQNSFLPPETTDAYTGGVRVVSATRGFTMVNCGIKAGNPLWLDAGRRPHRYARIEGNVFHGYPDNQYDNVMLRNLTDSIFEENEIFNGRRAVTFHKGVSRTWIGSNTIHHISGCPNASEIIMSEFGGWIYRGGVKQVSGKALTLGPDLGLAPGEIEKSGAQIYAYV